MLTAIRCERLETRAYLAAGALDTSFSSDGMTTVDIGTGGDFGYDMAVQADGKVVVVGDSFRTSGTSDFGVARLRTDGTLDTSFSGDGKTTTSFTELSGFDDFRARGVAIQPDQKIVVVGYARNSGNTDEDWAIARYNTDGSLDTSFSSDGKRILAWDIGGTATDNQDEAYAVVIQPDGKILVGGYAETTASTRRFALARFNANGSDDSSFTKQVFPSGSGRTDGAVAMALQADGKIVLAGTSTTDTTGGFSELAVIRITTSGNLDTSFSGDGRATFSTHPAGADGGSIGTGVAIQPDGKIVVSGRALKASGNGDFLAVRFTSGGSLDTSFNSFGFRTVAFDLGPSDNTTQRDTAFDVAIQDDGKIVLVGEARTGGSTSNHAMARLNADGSNDFTFFTSSGRRTVAYSSGSGTADSGRGVAIDFTGKIVVGGFTSSSSGNQFAVTRLIHNTAPTLNTSGDSFAIMGVGARQSLVMRQGTLVSDIVATGASGNPIGDADSGDREGIAITEVDAAFGNFQYTLVTSNPREGDWKNFTEAGSLSLVSALLLPSSARVRLATTRVPHHASGASFLPLESKIDIGFKYRAWDRTVGKDGGRHSVQSYGSNTDPTGSLAFNNSTEETVQVYFEARLFRTFNSNASLNVYSLEAEFNALVAIPGYEDRSTDAHTGFTVLLSPVPQLGSVPLYRLYYGVQFNANGTEVDMGYRYLTSNLGEAQGLEMLGPADKRPQRAGSYFRELGVNNGTGVVGYILSTQAPGTNEVVQIYRTDVVNKPTRPPGTSEGGTPTSFTPQENGDHVYTTINSFERTRTGAWRVESARGFARELSPIARPAPVAAAAWTQAWAAPLPSTDTNTGKDSTDEALSSRVGEIASLISGEPVVAPAPPTPPFPTSIGDSSAHVAPRSASVPPTEIDLLFADLDTGMLECLDE